MRPEFGRPATGTGTDHEHPGHDGDRPDRDDNLGRGARRERVLSHIRRNSHRMSERELAARVAAGDDRSPEEVPEDEIRDLHVALRHVDLPKAAEVGLVEWDPLAGTVEPAADPDAEAPLGELESRLLYADGWDGEATVTRKDRRRAALDALAAAGDELSVETLAARVAADEGGDPTERDVEAIATVLHHRHLPRLGDLGLVDYDPRERRVALREDAALRDGAALDRRDGPPAPPDSGPDLLTNPDDR